MPTQGQVLAGKYRLERQLGRGGFATVWAALNLQIQRPVALKILSSRSARDAELVARFVREATLAAREIHEAIVKVEDICTTAEGVPFLVMELLEGHTLRQELKARGALPLEECVEISRPLLQGLAAAHQHNVVHRDIKPGNVFLMRPSATGPAVKLVDLGLAKDLGVVDEVTRCKMVMGTPHYVAPEMFFTRSWNSGTPEADVFSCGVLLFEMLTASRPLDGELRSSAPNQALFELMDRYRTGHPLRGPAEVMPETPGPIDQVVRRALEIDATRRFHSASHMLDALEDALARMSRRDSSGFETFVVTNHYFKPQERRATPEERFPETPFDTEVDREPPPEVLAAISHYQPDSLPDLDDSPSPWDAERHGTRLIVRDLEPSLIIDVEAFAPPAPPTSRATAASAGLSALDSTELEEDLLEVVGRTFSQRALAVLGHSGFLWSASSILTLALVLLGIFGAGAPVDGSDPTSRTPPRSEAPDAVRAPELPPPPAAVAVTTVEATEAGHASNQTVAEADRAQPGREPPARHRQRSSRSRASTRQPPEAPTEIAARLARDFE